MQLWAKAAEWSAHPETRIHRAKQFRTWWLRAAMARGHAQWLLDELRHSPTLGMRIPSQLLFTSTFEKIALLP